MTWAPGLNGPTSRPTSRALHAGKALLRQSREGRGRLQPEVHSAPVRPPWWSRGRVLAYVFVASIAMNAAPKVVTLPSERSNRAMIRASPVQGGKKIAPMTDPTVRPVPSTIVASSFTVRKRAARHIFAPNQPRMRRRAAQTLYFPRSPMTSRPPGRSTRAISRIALPESGTKVRTVMHVTTSKLWSRNGSA